MTVNSTTTRRASSGSSSRYLVWLAQHDLVKGGDLRIPLLKNLPPTEPPLPPDDPTALAEFLKSAIPALESFQRNLGKSEETETWIAPADAQTDTAVWEFFLTERAELLKLKWIESEKAGADINWERAIQIWMREHRANWIKAHPPQLPSA